MALEAQGNAGRWRRAMWTFQASSTVSDGHGDGVETGRCECQPWRSVGGQQMGFHVELSSRSSREMG